MSGRRRKRQAYARRQYQTNKEGIQKRHREYSAENRVDHSFPTPLVESMTEVRCLGEKCWPKGKTFMSPFPKTVRLCEDCERAQEGLAMVQAHKLGAASALISELSLV